MGRGSKYSHEFFMLIDELELYGDEAMEDETGDLCQVYADDFKSEVGIIFKAEPTKEWVGNEGYFFCKNDRLKVGIDNSGGLPALFVIPETYNPVIFGRYLTDEKEYKIHRDVKRAFNKLIKFYPKVFRWPTTAWTSQLYTKY